MTDAIYVRRSDEKYPDSYKDDADRSHEDLLEIYGQNAMEVGIQKGYDYCVPYVRSGDGWRKADVFAPDFERVHDYYRAVYSPEFIPTCMSGRLDVKLSSRPDAKLPYWRGTLLSIRTTELHLNSGRFERFSKELQPYMVEFRRPWRRQNDVDLTDMLDVVAEIETAAWSLDVRKASQGDHLDEEDEMIVQVGFADLHAATHFKLLWRD